ncbi:MAG: DUF2834 domain-containing protein [Pseudomonadota bacterium]
MSRNALLLLAVIVSFGLYTVWVLMQFGYVGLLQAALANGATVQVFIDLVIACLLACIWMVADARRQGRNPWPYIVLTFAAGSFGPLVYLLVGQFAVRDETAA